MEESSAKTRRSDNEESTENNSKRRRLLDEWKNCRCIEQNPKNFMLGPEKLDCVKKLKDAVLTGGQCRAIAGVRVQGSGGVGKTTCILISHDDEVKEMYPDAQLWIELGHGATVATLLGQAARIVNQTGGAAMAEKNMRKGETNFTPVFYLARGWFMERRVLLVAENVFPSPVRTCRNYINTLKDMLGPGCCVLLSARSTKVSKTSDKEISFQPFDESQARVQKEMFMTHLGIEETDSRFHANLCAEIMHRSHGSPLALASAASLVRSTPYV